MSEPSSPEERYQELVRTLGSRPQVTHSAGEAKNNRFGATALKVDGRIFAMLVRGALVVKLPSRRVSSLIEQGRGGPFDAGKGRPMKEWLTLPAAAGEQWHELATEAMEFVGSNSPQP